MKTRWLDEVPTRWRRHGTRGRPYLALAACLLLAACSSGDNAGQAPAAATTPHNVTMTAAQRGHIGLYKVAEADYRRSVQANGVVDFDNDQATAVVAPISGRVTRLLVAPGDRVKAGQPLALVDSPDYAAAIGAYRKSLIAAKTAQQLADMDADLAKHDGVPQREAAQAATDAVAAAADRDSARQGLLALDVDASTIKAIEAGSGVGSVQGVIRAPIAGTVAERLITVGQLLAAGDTSCFTVADLSRVWVLAQVFGADADGLAVGDPAEVELGDGQAALGGKLTNVAAVVDPDTRAVTARVTVDNPHGALRKQMYVRVRIRSQQAQHGLLVPVSAVLRDDENLPFVYVADADGSFARRGVTLGYRSGDRYDVTAGLQAGESIVSDGAIFIRFMQTQ